MKKLLLALLLAMAGSGVVWADGIPQVVDSTTTARRTRIVFNDTGSTVTSFSVVLWDNDDTEFDRSGYPYVTTGTTADSVWVAGVTINDIPDQQLGEIVVEGPAITRIAGSSDNATEDLLVASSATVGQAGDFGPAANTCSLGTLMEAREAVTGATTSLGVNNTPEWVYVHIDCQ